MQTRPFELVDPAATLARLAKRLEPQGECEVWTGSVQSSGHGIMSVKTPAGWWVVKVHRVRWTIERGPIPVGMVIDHLCSNAPCVRLDHLEVVTQGENARRGNAGNGGETCRKCGATDWITNGTSRRCRPCWNTYTREWQRAQSGEHCCRECETPFTRTQTLVRFCSPECKRTNTLRRRRDWMREHYKPSAISA